MEFLVKEIENIKKNGKDPNQLIAEEEDSELEQQYVSSIDYIGDIDLIMGVFSRRLETLKKTIK